MVQRPHRVTLTMPNELKQRARVKALFEGRNLSEVVRGLLRDWLSEGSLFQHCCEACGVSLPFTTNPYDVDGRDIWLCPACADPTPDLDADVLAELDRLAAANEGGEAHDSE